MVAVYFPNHPPAPPWSVVVAVCDGLVVGRSPPICGESAPLSGESGRAIWRIGCGHFQH